MSRRKTQRYMMAVLSYYRSEWTDVSDKDKGYRLLVTRELEQVIRGCMRRGTNVPNAAKEVEIFIDLQDAKASTKSNLNPLPEGWRINLDKSGPDNELRCEPRAQECDDEQNP